MSYNTNALKYKRTYQSRPAAVSSLEDNYHQVFDPKNNVQFSLQAEPDIMYRNKIHNVNVYSGGRSVSQLLHYDYYIQLDQVYDNVVKVEMIGAILPNIGTINSEPCLIVDIKELNCIDFTNNDNNHSGFAILPIKPSASSFIIPELGCMYHTTFEPESAIQLSRLTVKIKDISGNIYDFGSPNGTVAKTSQHSFCLRITTSEVNRSDVIKERRVY